MIWHSVTTLALGIAAVVTVLGVVEAVSHEPTPASANECVRSAIPRPVDRPLPLALEAQPEPELPEQLKAPEN